MVGWRCLPGLMAVLWLAGCAPPPTPLPVIAPTVTPVVTAPTSAPAAAASTARRWQYGIATAPLPDTATLAEVADITYLDPTASLTDAAARFDVVIAYGVPPGWSPLPLMTATAALIINPDVPPFDNPDMAAALRDLLDPAELIAALGLPDSEPLRHNDASADTVRARLANAGFPDGFDVRLAATVPGAPALTDHLRTFAIYAHEMPLTVSAPADVGAALTAGRVDLALVAYIDPAARADWVAQVGADHVIDLYTLPLSYHAADTLSLNLTAVGLPLIVDEQSSP